MSRLGDASEDEAKRNSHTSVYDQGDFQQLRHEQPRSEVRNDGAPTRITGRATVPSIVASPPGPALESGVDQPGSPPPPEPPPAGPRPGGPPADHPPEPPVRKAARIFGEVFITIGLVVLLFAGYAIFGKYFETKAEQRKLDKSLENQWEKERKAATPSVPATPERLDIGDALAKLYIPVMGKEWVVVEGEDPKDIMHAPGHFRKSALPGEAGNFAAAGHRTPAIFWDLDRVSNGDVIGVETRDNWYVYRVYQTVVIDPSEIGVVAPDPSNPDSTNPTRKLLTLVTCNPKTSNAQRLIVHAELERTQPWDKGQPKELK